jgi:hypothetical protein
MERACHMSAMHTFFGHLSHVHFSSPHEIHAKQTNGGREYSRFLLKLRATTTTKRKKGERRVERRGSSEELRGRREEVSKPHHYHTTLSRGR